MKKQVTKKQAVMKLVEKLVRETCRAYRKARRTKILLDKSLYNLTGVRLGDYPYIVDRELRNVEVEIIKGILDRESYGEKVIELGKYYLNKSILRKAEANLRTICENLARVLAREYRIVDGVPSGDLYEEAEYVIRAARKCIHK
jgi:hypothetical protein